MTKLLTPVDIKSMNKIIENIESVGVECYDKLDNHIAINGGLSTSELVRSIGFHKFTNESLEYLINNINKHPNTFLGVGPFENKEGKWYNVRARKVDIINNLTEENIRLKDDMELLLGFMKVKNLNEEFIVWRSQLRS